MIKFCFSKQNWNWNIFCIEMTEAVFPAQLWFMFVDHFLKEEEKETEAGGMFEKSYFDNSILVSSTRRSR